MADLSLQRALQVHVHCARLGLREEDGSPEFIVAVTFPSASSPGSTSSIRTKTVSSGTDPVWNERITLFVVVLSYLSSHLVLPLIHFAHKQHDGVRCAGCDGHCAPEAACWDADVWRGGSSRGRRDRRPAHRMVRARSPQPQPWHRAHRTTAAEFPWHAPRRTRDPPHAHKRAPAHCTAGPAPVRTVVPRPLPCTADASHAVASCTRPRPKLASSAATSRCPCKRRAKA